MGAFLKQVQKNGHLSERLDILILSRMIQGELNRVWESKYKSHMKLLEMYYFVSILKLLTPWWHLSVLNFNLYQKWQIAALLLNQTLVHNINK